MKKTPVIIILVLFSLLKPLYAAEVLIKIANVDGQILEKYRGIGLNIFSRNETFSKRLGRALSSGVVAENSGVSGRKYIYKSSLIDRELNEVSTDITGRLPFKAVISGRKNPVTGSAWKKYILNFPSSSNYREGIFEIKAANNTYNSGKVSSIAVENNRGVFESWRITDLTNSTVYSENIVLRMKRSFFMQKLLNKSGVDWLMNLLPPDETVAAIVLEQNTQSELDAYSDTVLLFVRPKNNRNGSTSVTDISIVIGWSR
jgi:hypothetical protein